MNKYRYIIMLLFLLLSCKNENNNTSVNYETLEAYDINSFAESSGLINSIELYEYEVPLFLVNEFDVIINESKKCKYYQRNRTGFSIFFIDKNRINISPINSIFIYDYTTVCGFFIYKNHLFTIKGKLDEYKLIIKQKIKTPYLIPKTIPLGIYDAMPWVYCDFEYNKGMVKNNNCYVCGEKINYLFERNIRKAIKPNEWSTKRVQD